MFKLKNKATGQISWTEFATMKAAKAAVAANKMHGIACVVVDQFGNAIKKDYRGSRKNDAMQRMVDTWNFCSNPSTRYRAR